MTSHYDVLIDVRKTHGKFHTVEVKKAEYQKLTHDYMHWCNKQIFPRFLIVPPHTRPSSWIRVYFLAFVVAAAVVAVVVVAIVVVVIVAVAAVDAAVIVVVVVVVVDR